MINKNVYPFVPLGSMFESPISFSLPLMSVAYTHTFSSLFLQIVNLIEETGHFHITNTTFDFDLCSLDKTTVRKLQSYLETSGTS